MRELTSLYLIQPLSCPTRPTPLNTSTIAGSVALAKKRKSSTSGRGKTSSNNIKASFKITSQVEKEGHANIV